MGWNQGYKIFEDTVIGAYNLGKLDADLLAVLMEPYRGTDIDSGGSRGLITNDGKNVEQVVIETFGGTMPKPLNEGASDDEQCDYWDDVWEAFDKITTEKFGWK